MNDVKDLQNKKEETQEQEIDLREVVCKLVRERKIILKVCLIAAIIALVVGFSLPKEYTTKVQLAPEMPEGSSSKGSLGGLAAIAGINLSTNSGVDAYSVDLYPDIVNSTPFLLELLPLPVKTLKGQEYTIYEYLDEHQKRVWWSYIFSFPGQLMGWVAGIFTSSDKKEQNTDVVKINSVYILNEKQESILNNLRDRIELGVDKKTYVISISVKMQDPMVSGFLTQEILEKLQSYIIDYRTQKAKQDLDFTQNAFEEAKERYYDIQKVYAAFEDANLHSNKANYRTELERLKNEVTLAYNLYNSLAQQREQDKLRVQEQTPVFALIEPTKVPIRPSSPRKMLLLIGFIFLGGLFASIYVLLKEPQMK